MLQQSNVDKFLENCSDSDVKVIFEFLEAAKISSPESSELNSVINSLQKLLPPSKYSRPCTDDYLADSSSIALRTDSMKEEPLPNSKASPLLVDDDDEEEFIVRKVSFKQPTSPKITKSIQKKKAFIYENKATTQKAQVVDLTQIERISESLDDMTLTESFTPR